MQRAATEGKCNFTEKIRQLCTKVIFDWLSSHTFCRLYQNVGDCRVDNQSQVPVVAIIYLILYNLYILCYYLIFHNMCYYLILYDNSVHLLLVKMSYQV